MIVPTILAALAALPAISAQSTSVSAETATRCTTQFGFNPLPTESEGVPTWYTTTTTTSVFSQEITTQDTFTVTPSATTFTDVETTTTVFTTTETTTPAASTQPTPSSFLPLLVIDPASPTPFPAPTGSSRVMRAIEARGGLKNPFKRQSETAPGNVGGMMAFSNGSYSGIDRHYPHRVDCRVLVTEFDTVITTVTGTPETVTAPQSTATATSTETISSTTTITEVAPTPTIYQACQGNNVVDHITDVHGNTLRFDRLVFSADQGYPVKNQVVVNTTSATNCCIACQNTPFCAGSAYAPGASICQLFLTQPPTPYPGNDTATATTSVIPGPTGTPDNGTCSDGSLSNFIGTISGTSDFPAQYAVAFSNGPCGRYAVNPVSAPIESPGPVKRGLIAAK